jgi:hypothetical protein
MNGDVIHHFKATEFSYATIAIKFRFKFYILRREAHKSVCAFGDRKNKTFNSRGEKNRTK